MRHPAVIAAAAVLGAAALAGCGSQGVASPTPNTVVGTVSTTSSFPIVAAFHVKGVAKKGSAVFASAGCAGCHTLAAANATGTVGPNLDQLKPDYQAVTAQVTNGGPGMPAFGKTGQLSTQQIADVSAYVVVSTGGKAP
ncbi:MAG TPA: c-type cytochrome [Gaiellaceae bacterium]